jgi:CBS domain-containing protein
MGGQAAVQPTGAGTATRSQQAPGTATGRQAGARPRLPTTTIEDVLQTDTVTAAPETPIRTVVAQMAKEGVGSVVVTDGATPVGILTDREIALALEGIPNVADRQAGELLGETLVTGSTEMTVFQALDRLREEGIRRLPIVDEDGSLRGIVTLDDILVLLGTELANATELIRGQSPRL